MIYERTKPVGLGAIVVIGAQSRAFCSSARPDVDRELLLEEPLACIEILGRSSIARMVERFAQADLQEITVLAPEGMLADLHLLLERTKNVTIEAVPDVDRAIGQKLTEYVRSGIEHTFVMCASVYTENDLLDLFYFHREGRKTVTRARDRQGPVDLWVIDCAKAEHADLETLLRIEEGVGASYFVREYTNRLMHPRDLRQIANDSLSGRCAMRPSGREIRRGIWIDEGAVVHRRARIVAPAYIGRGSKVREDALVTRCSNIEEGCCVDYGTVVEDSSILANTHIGICLDVCHAVAKGNKLCSLPREVVIEVSDPSVMRSAVFVRPGMKSGMAVDLRKEGIKATVERQRAEARAPEAWQLGANPIEG
jgi:NDP-sugar pyrophosphorylase family protein